MTIILFIVDNSISMCQKTYFGCSLLDVAKKAVETFLKFRARDFNHRLDRIMLMTFDEFPTHLKVGWRETLLVFQNELKNMQATASSSGAEVLSSAFELLNVNRLQSGIDTYGQGRNPFYVESSVVILLTDGQSFANKPDLTITVNNRIAGLELTREAYRWDQRLFTILLKIPGVKGEEVPLLEEPRRDTSVLEGLSSLTGGRSFVIEAVKTVDLVMQRIAENMQNGVMVRFEPLDNSFPSQSGAITKMIFLPKNPQKTHVSGHWPLPEPFWLDLGSKSVLPPRNAHPILRYKPCMESIPSLPMIGEIYFPVDKYEVESSTLTLEVVEKSQRFSHWQVFIDAESADQAPVHQLCGYLVAQQNGPEKTLFLHLLPFDYPRLLELFDKFSRNHNKKEWKSHFDAYIQSIPPYYAAALRRFLVKVNLHSLIPEVYDQCLSLELQNYLRKVKAQSKTIFDNTLAYPNQPFPAPDLVPVLQKSSRSLFARETVKLDSEGGFDDLLARSVADQLESDAAAFKIHLRPPSILYQRNHIVLHRNPFDVDREDLVSQLRNLKFSLLHPEKWKGSEEPDRNVPIAQMGNYQDYLKNAAQPLRDIDETNKFDRPMFGNPFIKKKQKVGTNAMGGMVDEADVDVRDVALDESSARSKRSLSETRDRSSLHPTSSKRSKSASPGLKSPIKQPRPILEDVTVTSISNDVPAPAPGAINSSKRKLLLESLSSEKVSVKTVTVSEAPMLLVESVTTPIVVNGEPAVEEMVVNGEETTEVTANEDMEVDSDAMQRFRLRALKAIKTPGRNFTPILDMINELNGTAGGSLRDSLVHQIITEAGRFRRESLISLLRETYLAP